MAKLPIEKDLINRLVPEVSATLSHYGIEHSEYGIRKNLEEWWDNKGWRITLLRRHPNWNEDALAVVLNVSEERTVCFETVYPKKNALTDLFFLLKTDEDEKRNAKRAIDKICGEYKAKIEEQSVCDEVMSLTGVNCVVGQKASRVIGAICRKIGFDDVEDAVTSKKYRSAFAALCDALCPGIIERPSALSVHPCDFLTMSDRDNGWSSCHELKAGGWRAGTLSLMNDNSTMVFYTTEKLSAYQKMRDRKKLTRQLFSYRNGILIQSRLYGFPIATHGDAKKSYRALVQGIIAECVGLPNMWTLPRQTYREISGRIIYDGKGLQYQDCRKSNDTSVSYLQGMSIAKSTKVRIGNNALCLCCGNVLKYSHYLKCGRHGCNADYELNAA